ncbi:hypothetical protein K458DRAFT_417704 [Lentithecium fluviatile CBS 122367]|uniref:DUF3074 domain-containing protein n=1 Tax=Lentithecium fluviatile CBS 122367 TaxID=1168545 RepID=A0A6G1J2V6_9PLEO|nr:hypothetical protein K458DRAFT_417704 [Lentithecium fluviatile CBS 122367]
MVFQSAAPPDPVSNAPVKLTPKLKLQALGPNELPWHPDLASHQTSPPDLSAFFEALFQEVRDHFNIPTSDIGTSKDSVTSRGKTYPVVVHKTKCVDREGLLWFGRRSEHEEGEPVGFENLRAVLMKEHERNEQEYTPAVYDVNVLVNWEGVVRGKDFCFKDAAVEDVEMRITQMHHKMPGVGLNDRVFTVLLLSFLYRLTPSGDSPNVDTSEAIDVQLPIDLSLFPAPVLSRSHTHADITPTSSTTSGPTSHPKLVYDNNDATATPEQKKRNGKDVVEGRYVSWEKLRRAEEGKTTEWTMRTASDAGGVLPAWMQRLGVPGAIAKDVPLAVRFAVERGEGGVEK